MAQTELLGELGLLQVLLGRAPRASPQRPHERLVEEVLDHHRRVPAVTAARSSRARSLSSAGDVRLAAEEVVDELAALGAARQIELDRAVEASRPEQRRVEVVGAVRGRDDEDVGRDGARVAHAQLVAQEDVDAVRGTSPGCASGRCRFVERLQLDEQLVHHAGDAFARRRCAHAAARAADGIDLLDEADGAALTASRRAQRLEVRRGSCGWSGRSTSTGTPTTTRTGTGRPPRAPSPWPRGSCRCRAGLRTARRGAGEAPSWSRIVSLARNRFSVRTTSSRTTSQPTTSSSPVSMSWGR